MTLSLVSLWATDGLGLDITERAQVLFLHYANFRAKWLSEGLILFPHPLSVRYSCERSPRPFHGLFERPMENLLLIMTIWIQRHFYLVPTKSLYRYAGQFVSAAFCLIFPHLHNALSFCSASPYTCWSLCEVDKFFFHNLKAFAILARLPFHWISKCSSM